MTGPAIDLLYTEDEEDLRSTVRAVLRETCPPSHILVRLGSGEPHDPSTWQVLVAQIGITGLAVPERHGGAGAGLREVAVVLEELGRAVAPVPYLGSAVAGWVLAAVGETTLLGRQAAGEVLAALAVPLDASPFDGPVRALGAEPVRVRDGLLTGAVRDVVDMLAADVLLVPTDAGLYAVDAAQPGVTRRPVVSLDQTRPLAELTLDGAAGRLLADPDRAAEVLSAGLRVGAALLAAEQVGLAQGCLDSTVEYLRLRHQFGRPIGSFQALKHRLADLWVEIGQARAVARYAVGCVAAWHPDADVAVATAQAHCSPVAVRAAEECVQMHGGIGFTWEHPAHLALKRARADAIAFGSTGRHRAALAAMVDLVAP